MGVAESNLEAFAEQAMQNLKMTESELEEFLDKVVNNPDTIAIQNKSKEEAAAAAEGSTAMVITWTLIGLGYLVAWFFYKDKDGWLWPYLGSFFYIFVIYSPVYYVSWWLVHTMNSVINTSIPPYRY